MSIWKKIYEWGVATPYRKAITTLVLYVMSFCMLRFLIDPQEFLNDIWHEIIYAVVGGLFTSMVVLGVELKKQREQH